MACVLTAVKNGIRPAPRALGRNGPMPLGSFAEVVSINLVGTCDVERGVVVSTASEAGVAGMTLPLARDLSSSLVRVMTIAPRTSSTTDAQRRDHPAGRALRLPPR